MKIVSEKEFIEELHNSENNHLRVDLANDIDENGRLLGNTGMSIHNEITMEYLRKLGFNWTDIDSNYIRNYL